MQACMRSKHEPQGLIMGGGNATLLGREENDWSGSDRTGSLGINNALCSPLRADRVSPTAVLHTSTQCKLQHITAELNNKVDRCSRPIDKSDQEFMTNFCRFWQMHADNHMVKCMGNAKPSCQSCQLIHLWIPGICPKQITFLQITVTSFVLRTYNRVFYLEECRVNFLGNLSETADSRSAVSQLRALSTVGV